MASDTTRLCVSCDERRAWLDAEGWCRKCNRENGWQHITEEETRG